MIAQVRPADLPAWLEAARAHGEPVVLDVREPYEQQMASVAENGFQLCSIPMGIIPPRLAELDPNQPIACLCHHGMRSMNVAAFLEQHGFEHLANISGGIDAWSHEVDPAVPRY